MAAERPSKSAQKRAALAIRALADELVLLKPGLLSRVIKDDDVEHAVREAQAIQSHGALRRQKQYIARRLRDIDATAVRDALDAIQADDKQDKRRFRTAERLRDALLAADAQQQESLLQDAGIAPGDALRDAIGRYATATDAATRKNAGRTVFRALYAALETRPSSNQDTAT